MSSKLQITIEIENCFPNLDLEQNLKEFLDFEGYETFSIKIEEIKCSQVTQSGSGVQQKPKQLQ